MLRISLSVIAPRNQIVEQQKPQELPRTTVDLQFREKARRLADQDNSASVLIIYKGAIVQSWGDANRRFRMHSSRKAIRSALIGIYASKGAFLVNHLQKSKCARPTKTMGTLVPFIFDLKG
jgi:hypothetical protein